MWMFSPDKICHVTDLFELVYWEIKLTEMTTFTNQCPGENKKPKKCCFLQKKHQADCFYFTDILK